MNITIVGSSDLEVSPEIAATIVGILSTLEPGQDVVHIRAKRSWWGHEPLPTSPIEEMVASCGKSLGVSIEYHYPEGQPGRANFVRDRNMVRAGSDFVYAFLSESALRENVSGSRKDDILGGGTGHVINVAIQESVPSECYVVGSNGVPVFFGGSE